MCRQKNGPGAGRKDPVRYGVCMARRKKPAAPRSRKRAKPEPEPIPTGDLQPEQIAALAPLEHRRAHLLRVERRLADGCGDIAFVQASKLATVLKDQIAALEAARATAEREKHVTTPPTPEEVREAVRILLAPEDTLVRRIVAEELVRVWPKGVPLPAPEPDRRLTVINGGG